jgi:chromosome segregation ATPase
LPSKNNKKNLNINPEEKPLNKSTNLTNKSIDSQSKLQILESFIDVIKTNSYVQTNKIIEDKKRLKDLLQNKVDILNSNIRAINRENKTNSSLSKNITKENERLVKSGERANKNSYFLNKELPGYRIEIDDMKNKITQLNEETKFIENSTIEIEREIFGIQDEIKKTNGLNSAIIKDKEKINNEIVTLKKHIDMLKGKIQRIEHSSNEFMNSVGILVQESLKNVPKGNNSNNISKILTTKNK